MCENPISRPTNPSHSAGVFVYMSTMLQWAKWYSEQNLDVVPVQPHGKAVALPAWEEYQTRCSTPDEIESWWTQMPTANIGIVSGVNNFVTIDIDHDKGAETQMRRGSWNCSRAESSKAEAAWVIMCRFLFPIRLTWDTTTARTGRRETRPGTRRPGM